MMRCFFVCTLWSRRRANKIGFHDLRSDVHVTILRIKVFSSCGVDCYVSLFLKYILLIIASTVDDQNEFHFKRSIAINLGEYKSISHSYILYNVCVGGLEKSVPRNAVWHHEVCRVMTNDDREGLIFYRFIQ